MTKSTQSRSALPAQRSAPKPGIPTYNVALFPAVPQSLDQCEEIVSSMADQSGELWGQTFQPRTIDVPTAMYAMPRGVWGGTPEFQEFCDQLVDYNGLLVANRAPVDGVPNFVGGLAVATMKWVRENFSSIPVACTHNKPIGPAGAELESIEGVIYLGGNRDYSWMFQQGPPQ